MENILRLELIISYFINWTSTIICFQFGILLLSCFMGTRCVLFIFSTPVQEIEYLCPFKVIYWTSNLLCDGIGGRAIMNRISAIRKVSQESSLAPFCRVMLQWEDGYQRGSQLSPGTKFVCTSIVDFPASRTMRKKFLLCRSHLAHGILLQFPEWPKIPSNDSSLQYC